MHKYSVFNSVYYPKERENDTINDIYSDLRHVTIAQHLWGWVDVWPVITYNVALFFYCFAVFSRQLNAHHLDILHKYIDYILR